ncbi:MAG: cyclase family protein [Anaerolineales bacterium]|nr:cyclase family protein [Anaerolineales bacterium]
MQLIDISVGISPDLPVWPGDPEIVLDRTSSIASGDPANVSRLASGVHVGTHVDAPLHFVEGGAAVDELPLVALVGPAHVIHLPDVDLIDAAALRGAEIPDGAARLLFKTSNGRLWSSEVEGFQRDYVAIEESGARWLVEREVRLVGVDYLSVAPWGASVATHRVLLEAGVVVVEGLDLRPADAGEYTLYCLPVKLIGSDGAPARALLAKND